MTLKNILALISILVISIGTAVISAADFPSDEQITKILTTTNDGEISLAKLAEKKAESKDVKKFAKEMVKDHAKNNKKTLKISKKMDMAPEENPKAGELRAETEKNMAALQNLSGKEFDKAYISMQVQAHQKVLNDLDTTLIPAAKNEKLKKQLEKTRSTVAEHLDEAKKISTKL